MIDIYIIGITGKIASGKSTVADMLGRKLYCSKIIDVDTTAKEIYKRNPVVLEKLKDCFGDNIFYDGKICFKRLGEIVFSSKDDLEKLNFIMVPEIEKELKRQINLLKKDKEKSINFLIIDAAILFNTRIYNYCDFIILIKADIKKRCKILIQKNSVCIEDAMLRIKGQHIRLKRKSIDYIIENKLTKKELEAEVDNIVSTLKEKSKY